MESHIIDYYNNDLHNINIIEKLLKEINQLEEKLKHMFTYIYISI